MSEKKSEKHILLVEGEADRGFFEVLCRKSAIEVAIRVATPKDLASTATTRNTKEGVFNLLPALLKQLEDGGIEKLAVVVDADSQINGGGFPQACTRVSVALQSAGYILSTASPAEGLIFEHTDGFADVGLWVMPNNADEGMLEDWIRQCLHPDETALYQHGCIAIDKIPGSPKFKSFHRTKAEVATWLAWQDKPGHGLYNAVNPQLLNPQAPLYSALQGWLKKVFTACPDETATPTPP